MLSTPKFLGTNNHFEFTKISHFSLAPHSPIQFQTHSFCLQESWINPDVADFLASMDGFKLYRQDKVSNLTKTGVGGQREFLLG